LVINEPWQRSSEGRFLRTVSQITKGYNQSHLLTWDEQGLLAYYPPTCTSSGGNYGTFHHYQFIQEELHLQDRQIEGQKE